MFSARRFSHDPSLRHGLDLAVCLGHPALCRNVSPEPTVHCPNGGPCSGFTERSRLVKTCNDLQIRLWPRRFSPSMGCCSRKATILSRTAASCHVVDCEVVSNCDIKVVATTDELFDFLNPRDLRWANGPLDLQRTWRRALAPASVSVPRNAAALEESCREG